ncbi:hypothetical protein ACSBR1_015566 [Camellia fascicularis]
MHVIGKCCLVLSTVMFLLQSQVTPCNQFAAHSVFVVLERLRGSGDDIAATDYADALKPSVIALPLHGSSKSTISHDYSDHLALVRAYEG